jgi:phosphopantothenate synthetase
MIANHDGPIVEQSDGPLDAGSWFVLKFDQLRARVEYSVLQPERHVAAQVSLTGFGSGGKTWRRDYVLTPLDEGSRTRVVVTTDGKVGLLRWGPLVRAAESASAKRMRDKMESATSAR